MMNYVASLGVSYVAFRYFTAFDNFVKLDNYHNVNGVSLMTFDNIKLQSIYVLNNNNNAMGTLSKTKYETFNKIFEQLNMSKVEGQTRVNDLEIGSTYKVRGYGIYMPKLGIFPVVTSIKDLN